MLLTIRTKIFKLKLYNTIITNIAVLEKELSLLDPGVYHYEVIIKQSELAVYYNLLMKFYGTSENRTKIISKV